MDALTRLRNKHRERFTNRINVDIHSGGGWSPQFWAQAEVGPVHESIVTSRRQSSLIAGLDKELMVHRSSS